MSAGLKIIWGVVEYRLRKLEMANLAAAGSIAVALALPLAEIAYRVLFAFVLNVLVYLNNDYLDVHIDLQSADKDQAKSRFLAEHLRTAYLAQWALGALLLLLALAFDVGLLVPAVLGGGICIWYSLQLKHRPWLDILAMTLWGFAMPLCGAPVTSVLGVALTLQLALFSGVFETIQVMRDADEDRDEGVRTTGVVLGQARSLLLARALMVASSVYALLVLHPVAAAISAMALAVPFAKDRIERYWNQVKLVSGLAWLFLCAYVFVTGQSAGLLWSFTRAGL